MTRDEFDFLCMLLKERSGLMLARDIVEAMTSFQAAPDNRGFYRPAPRARPQRLAAG